MESTIERISPVECRVKVEVPWSDVSARLETKMRDLRRRARLPGFRPGKIPNNVLERMFGKSVRQELARDLVEETFPAATSQNAVIALTPPVVESSVLENDAAFQYSARFEVPPQITPKDYTGVPVRRRPATADENKVTAELEAKQKQLTELHPLPEGETREVTQPGDVWTVDLEGTLGSTRVSRKDVRVDIGDPDSEFIPGLAAALAELRLDAVGQVQTLRFTPPPERVKPELRGQEVVLQAGLRAVQVKRVPALDDEFARDTGEAETLDELRGKIRERLAREDGEEAERDARRRLVVSLLERNEFEPAPSLVSREVRAQLDATKRQLAQQGLTLAQLGTSEADLAQRIRGQAVFNVKAYLLLDAIGKVESLEVDEEAFQAELAEMAERNGQNLAKMRAQMEKNNQLVLLRAQMREEKILDFLMAKAVVTEAPDPVEDAEAQTL